MAFQAEVEPVQSEQQVRQWSLVSRIAFRFCFVYFGLYCLGTQIITSLLPIPNVNIPDPGTLWPVRQIVFWTAAHIFHVTKPLVYTDSGSGDKIFDWVLVFCLLLFTALIVGVWSVIDRKRKNYAALHAWFRLFIRFSLAGQLIVYGASKAVPLQMPFPRLTKLIEPFGNFSPMGVLWASIGASPAYEIFAGWAEMLGGILLILPRTTMFGALICLADMTQVFMLNMTYDVPVKLLSFHLILISLFLISPDFDRLGNFLFMNRAVEPSMKCQLFKARRAGFIALMAQVIFGVSLLGINVYGSWAGWRSFGGGSPKSPLYGIWSVEQLSIDGQLRSPLLNDYGRWRRVIFDIPTRISFQRMDDSVFSYDAAISLEKKSVALTGEDEKNWKGDFTFQRAAPDQLTLDGDMDGHKIHADLRLADRNKFLVVSRGFHWIQEYPLNR